MGKLPMLLGKDEVLLEEEIEVKNPADTRMVVGTVPRGTKEHVDQAVEEAQRAFETEWSRLQLSREREKVMRLASSYIEKDIDELSRLYTQEQGKPLAEAKSEIQSFLSTMDYYAGYGGKIYGSSTKAKSGNGYLYVEDEPFPIGVIAALTPWNFEISLLGWKVAPALIAGNSIIVKPSATTPLTTIEVVNRIRRAIRERGYAEGVINVVTGKSNEIGDYIVGHSGIRKVFFTGSTDTGLRVYQKAAAGIRSVTLELGGSDPTIVTDSADIKKAAGDIVTKGRFRNAGQSCTSIKRLFVYSSVYDEFMKQMLEQVRSIRVGNGLQEGITMGPLHNEAQRESMVAMVEDAKANNGRILVGGSALQGIGYADGHFYSPTVIDQLSEDAMLWKEEAFGPVLPVRKVGGIEEALDLANKTRYGLGACIWTNNLREQRMFLDRIESGIRWVNSAPLSVPETSFGGVKASGFGRELGEEGLKENLELRSARIFYPSE